MSAHLPPPPDVGTLLHLVRLARLALDELQSRPQPIPAAVERALTTFYQLSDYHGIAPADAPHIPDDGLI
jgi:hypothetical protein